MHGHLSGHFAQDSNGGNIGKYAAITSIANGLRSQKHCDHGEEAKTLFNPNGIIWYLRKFCKREAHSDQPDVILTNFVLERLANTCEEAAPRAKLRRAHTDA